MHVCNQLVLIVFHVYCVQILCFSHIFYYSAPQDGENHIQNSKALAEYQARKNAISITSTIFRAATDLLHRAQGITHESFAKVIGSANIFSTLLPMGVAYIGPVAAMDPRVR